MLMLILVVFCLAGIIIFIKNRRNNFWWRWIYIFGGGYVLFDIMAVALNVPIWHNLLRFMFNTGTPYYHFIWGFFCVIGAGALLLGLQIFKAYRKIAPGQV